MISAGCSRSLSLSILSKCYSGLFRCKATSFALSELFWANLLGSQVGTSEGISFVLTLKLSSQGLSFNHNLVLQINELQH